MNETKVCFSTKNHLVQNLFDSAEEKCRNNLKMFGDRKVLIEGGGYEKVWIETQPMGGAMYGKRDLEVAYNNCKIFMDYQREDGRLPGSIEYKDGKCIPQYDKFQGFCFPGPALDVYYLIGKDKDYLIQLFEVLEKYNEYLWKYRDSDGDGCLESWCRYDTGEDNAVRYADAPDYWLGELAPSGFKVVPIASMDFMSFSYSALETMAEICGILGKEEKRQRYFQKSQEIKGRIKSYLWDEKRGAFFDRDKNHDFMPTLIHNNLRMMYWNSMYQPEADRFVKEHLLNVEEFWTKLPLPSVAANDPLYLGEKVNNWSGQPQALTYQRAIAALENYGYYELIPYLGKKLFEAIGENCIFVQQYDPFTMEPSLQGISGKQDAYGPAMLSVLEYISRMYGVHISRDKVVWGSVIGEASSYEQLFEGHSYKLEQDGKSAAGFIDGSEIFCCRQGFRKVTALDGKEI